MEGLLAEEEHTPFIKEGLITLQGTDQVDGVSCYFLFATLVDEDSLQLIQPLTHQKIGGFKGLPFSFSEDFRNIKLSYWIDKKSYRVIKSEITANLAVEIMGKKFNGNLTHNTRFFDYNEEFSMPLPDEFVKSIK